MTLFKKSLTAELSESKVAYSSLEKDFNDYKAAHSAFEAQKAELDAALASHKTELETLKTEKATLLADLETAKTSVTELSAKAESVTNAALLELDKVGQAPVAQAAAVVVQDEGKHFEEIMNLRGQGKHEEARAYYEKNIKGKK